MADRHPGRAAVDASLGAAAHAARRLAAHPARHPGAPRLRPARGRPRDRRGAEPEPRRSPRRHHLLPRFPLRARRPPRGPRVPRRVVPVARRRGAAGARVRAARRGGPRHHAPTAPSRSSRSTASATAPCRRRSWWTGRSTGGSRRERLNSILRRAPGAGLPRDPGLRPPRLGALSVGAEGGRARHRRGGRAARRRRSSWCATARAACTGWSRSSRSRRRPGRVAYGPVDRGRRARPVRRRLPRGPAARPSARPAGGDSLPRPAGAAHLRAGRHHRPGLGRGLRGARRLSRAPAGARAGAGRRGRGGDPVGPARPRRRGVPHRHQVEDRAGHRRRSEVRRLQRRRRRLAARSPTAWSWKAIRWCWSRA